MMRAIAFIFLVLLGESVALHLIQHAEKQDRQTSVQSEPTDSSSPVTPTKLDSSSGVTPSGTPGTPTEEPRGPLAPLADILDKLFPEKPEGEEVEPTPDPTPEVEPDPVLKEKLDKFGEEFDAKFEKSMKDLDATMETLSDKLDPAKIGDRITTFESAMAHRLPTSAENHDDMERKIKKINDKIGKALGVLDDPNAEEGTNPLEEKLEKGLEKILGKFMPTNPPEDEPELVPESKPEAVPESKPETPAEPEEPAE